MADRHQRRGLDVGGSSYGQLALKFAVLLLPEIVTVELGGVKWQPGLLGVTV